MSASILHLSRICISLLRSDLSIPFTEAHITKGVLETGQSLYRLTEASRWHVPLNSFQSAHDFAAVAFRAH